MYWGIIGVTAVAFSCSTEFIPEINEQMKLVKFTDEFKFKMTCVMILDYAGCWVTEIVFKYLFSDLKARDIAIRRPDQIAREEKRKAEEQLVKDKVEEEKQAEKVKEFEKKVEDRRAKVEAWANKRGTGPTQTAPVTAGAAQ